MAPTLASLLQQVTPQQAFQLLLTYYQAASFPVTAWEEFGTELTRAQAMSTAVSDAVTNLIPAIAGGSLLDYAPNYPGWTQLLASNGFGLDANLATFTQGYMLATNNSGSAYTFSPSSQLTATVAASGNRYFSLGSGTIPAKVGSSPGTLLILFQAEFAGQTYSDPSNLSGSAIPPSLTLSTSLPGVILTNPSSNYSGITHTGSGTGTLTLGGAPTGSHSLVIIVTATSTSSPASLSYELDGAAAVSLGSVSSVTNLAGLGINITLNNGSSGSSWVNGDTYSFSTPASWISSQGANAESDPALAARCRNKWSTQSVIPTQSLYQYLATSTPGVGAQVTQVFSVPDTTINNKINVVVAGPGGVLPSPTITLIQNFITPRARGCDNPVVQSPTTTPITYALTVTVSAQQSVAATAAINTVLLLYTALIPVNGTIKLSDIDALIKPNPITGQGGIAGVTDIAGVTINGSAANLTLGSPTTFVLPAYPPTIALSVISQ